MGRGVGNNRVACKHDGNIYWRNVFHSYSGFTIYLALPTLLLSSSLVSAPTLLLRDSSFGGLARTRFIRLLDGESWGLGWCWVGGVETLLVEGWCWVKGEVLTVNRGGGEGDVVSEIRLMSFNWSSNFLFASLKNLHYKGDLTLELTSLDKSVWYYCTTNNTQWTK